MYDYLRGKLIQKSAAGAVIEAGGVGYQVLIPLSTFERLPLLGQETKVLTHFVVREDAQLLYGFATEEERDLFKLLISVTGIGPKMALVALSGIPIGELKRAIVEGELDRLTAISGIGRKTAERIVIELREKLVLQAPASKDWAETSAPAGRALVDDSVEALVALGYRKQNAKTAIEKALKQCKDKPDAMSLEDLIRASLKHV